MKIVKRLITEGTSVNAVLINDEGEEYPVFLESLHNTVMFPLLLDSGYELQSLPYGFVKDGVAFDSLPVENYTPTDTETDAMYNAIGAKLPYEEIKSHVNASTVVGLPIPPQNITIHTREELIKYLEATMAANLDEDFYPLNYFVAKEALFSRQEFEDTDNKRYTDAIIKRRTMSLRKFHNLIAWLKDMGLLGPNYTFMDVLDAYFAWGVDGMDLTLIGKRRETRPYRLSLNRAEKTPVIRFTQGFLDGSGDMLTPAAERDVVWKITNANQQEYIQKMTQGLDPNETVLVQYQASATEDVTILEGLATNVMYSADVLIYRYMSMPTILVKSPSGQNSYLNPTIALPNATDKLYEDNLMRAIAKMVYKRRRSKIKVSSYEALQVAGANPKSALDYITTQLSMATQRQDSEIPMICQSDIDNYVFYGKDPYGLPGWDEKKAFLDDIVDGTFNIDGIGHAQDIENGINDTTVYKELYAIHNVLGVSLEDIYTTIRDAAPDAKYVNFTDGKVNHKLPIGETNYLRNGYLSDVQNYDLSAAEFCTFFTYVTRVAREVGTPEASEHVGIEFWCVNRASKHVQYIVDYLLSQYEAKVQMTITDPTEQAKAMRMKHVFALSRFYEIALKGSFTWSKQLGGETVAVESSLITQARGCLELKIESLISYLTSNIYAASAGSLSFNGYCVNAYITPTCVIPRGKSPIPEIPFYALWHNYSQYNPVLFAQLVGLGELPNDYEGWETRYSYLGFADEHEYNFSLSKYYLNARTETKDYPVDRDFVSVTSPLEMFYPGLYDTDVEHQRWMDMPTLPVPRQGEPIIKLGAWRNITIDDFRDKLYPSNFVVEPDQYIRPFQGYSAEGFIMLGEEVFTKMPPEDGEGIIAYPRSETVYIASLEESFDFRRLPEYLDKGYNIIHAYDRTYLFRDVSGKVWEAQI